MPRKINPTEKMVTIEVIKTATERGFLSGWIFLLRFVTLSLKALSGLGGADWDWLFMVGIDEISPYLY